MAAISPVDSGITIPAPTPSTQLIKNQQHDVLANRLKKPLMQNNASPV